MLLSALMLNITLSRCMDLDVLPLELSCSYKIELIIRTAWLLIHNLRHTDGR